jgi:outer membrane protein OmpA-like peptidoglycan-associated protein
MMSATHFVVAVLLGLSLSPSTSVSTSPPHVDVDRHRGPPDVDVPTSSAPPTVVLPKGVTEKRRHHSVTWTVPDSVLSFVVDTPKLVDPTAAARVIDALVAAIRAHDVRRVIVTGYASADGPSARYDLDLSQARANAVCDMLETRGTDHAILWCRGAGREDVPPSGAGPEDRRVVIRARFR